MKTRIFIGVLGALIVAFALAAPNLNLIGFEANGGSQIVLLLLGVFLLVIALASKRMKPGAFQRAYQGVAIMLLNTLLFLVICELFIVISFNLQLLTSNSSDINSVGGVAGYSDQPWHPTYWAEHNVAASLLEYSAFSLWEHREFEGETINIAADGSRLTPGAECSEGAYRIFVYGGSTTWGMGSPDDMTIPAYLQTALAGAVDRPVCVINYGALANVSTQNVIRLLKHLQRGDIPDMVIFYDGINEVVSTHQTHVAGLHRNYDIFRQAVVGRLKHPLVDWLSESYTFKFIGALLPKPPGNETVDYPLLAQETATIYLENTKVVSTLGEQYGFETYFFWQPVMPIEHKPLTPEEEVMNSIVTPRLLELYQGAWAAVKAANYPNVYYIADVFDDRPEDLYFDHQHLMPQGNQIVAQAIFEIVIDAAQRGGE